MSLSPRLPALVGLACLLTAAPGPALAGGPAAPAGRPTSSADLPSASVIVRGVPGGGAALQAAVAAAGGSVTRSLGLVDGLVARVPAAAVQGLSRAPGVTAVTRDGRLRLSGAETQDGAQAAASPLAHITAAVRARSARTGAISGRGVDVAVLDSGVVPVDGLRAPGKVVNGADLSFDSGTAAMRHLDGYGHGTHMAASWPGATTR